MDTYYQVRMRGSKDVLFVGTIYECEKWIHTDGTIDVTYEISKARPIKTKETKDVHN